MVTASNYGNVTFKKEEEDRYPIDQKVEETGEHEGGQGKLQKYDYRNDMRKSEKKRIQSGQSMKKAWQ